MKNILGLFFLISLGASAQKIRPFIGGSVYIHTGFSRSSFVDLKVGTEYKLAYYLNPEIEINYMFGFLEEVVDRDDTGFVLSEYSKRVSAMNYSFCPKIILGNKKGDDDGYLQILPKYTYSSIEAIGNRVSTNPNDLSKSIKEKVFDNQHSFGIGLGYVSGFSKDNSESFAFNIYFSNIDLGKALNKLKQNEKFNTQSVIGFGVNYYFVLKKKNK